MSYSKSLNYILVGLGIGIFVIMMVMYSNAETQEDNGGDALSPSTRAPANNTYMDTATYIGSAACGGCHNQNYVDWQNSLHSKMVQPAISANVIGDFNDVWFNATVQNGTGLNKTISMFLFVDGVDYKVTLNNGSDFADNITHRINYTLGSSWKQRYMTVIGNNTLILPMQWNTVTSEWVLYHSDYWFDSSGSDDNATPKNASVDKSWEKGCGGCHSTGFNVVYNASTTEYIGTYEELNVGCEACHGPGSAHQAAAPSEKPNTIWKSVDPQICGSCHGRGQGLNDTTPGPYDAVGYSWNSTQGAYMPGDDLSEFKLLYNLTNKSKYFWADGSADHHRMQYNDMYGPSGHKGEAQPSFVMDDANCQHCHSTEGAIMVFDAGNNNVDGDTFTTALVDATPIACSACHDSHDATIKHQLRKDENELCISCHSDYPTSGPGDIPRHNQKQIFEGTVAGNPQTSASFMNNSVGCVDCHMPKVAKSAIVYDIHSHTFKFFPPSETISNGVPNSCNVKCHGGLSSGTEANMTDAAADAKITEWKTAWSARVTEVKAAMDAAQTALDKYNMGYDPVRYQANLTLFEEGEWAYLNSAQDPSGGVHNHDYLMEMLDTAEAKFDKIVAELDLGANYIGSSNCAACHPGKATKWKETAHAKKFMDIANATVLGDFTTDPTLNDTGNNIPNTTFDLTESGGVYTIKMNDTVTYTIDYVIGAGVWKQRFVTTINQSRYILPIQWNTVTGEWVAYDIKDWYKPNGELKSIGLDRSWEKRCGGCHSTGYSVSQDTDTGEYIGEYIEVGIACEACHGPGSEHKAASTVAERKAKIVKSYSSEVCGQCHARGSSAGASGAYGFPWSDTMGRTKAGENVSDYWSYQAYTPGVNSAGFWADNTSVKHRQQFMDFTMAGAKGNYVSFAMTNPDCQHCMSTEGAIMVFDAGDENVKAETITTAIENATALTCSACHDMHDETNTVPVEHNLRKPSEDLCISCHTDSPESGPGDEPHHNQLQIWSGNVSNTIKGDPMMGGFVECADCHMPKVAKSAVKYDIASHTFRFMSPANSLKYPGLPNSCTVSCHSFDDQEAADVLSNWSTQINDKIEEVHDLLVEAEAIIIGMDVNDTDYTGLKSKYDTANWSFVNVEDDPSNGAHNFDYEMELLEHAKDLFQEIIDSQKPGGIISGKVTDADGNAVVGANVTVGLLYTVTDSNGDYQIAGATPGTGLNVTVSDVMFFGYVRYDGTFNASVDLTDVVTVNFVLNEHALPVTVSPADGATGVAVDTTITVTFSENVNMSSLDITVMAGTTAVTGTFTLDNTTNMATFTPGADLAEGTMYTVTVDDAVMGTDDDPILWKDKVWSFTTKSTFAASVKVKVSGTDTVIQTGLTLTGVDKDTTITITFPVNVDSTTISLTLSEGITVTLTSYDNTTFTAVFTPGSELGDGATYTITLGTGLKDANGNSLIDTAMTWAFTTKIAITYSLDLGPIKDKNGDPIEGAKVTVTIDGVEYTGTTDADGEVSIGLPAKPAAGTWKVKVTHDDYDTINYDIIIDANGDETQTTIPAMKKSGDDGGNTMLIIAIVVIILVIVILMVVMLMRKKPEEEEAPAEEEEEEAAGEFECPACGAVVSSEEKVCPECGEEFEEEVFKCPECGTELESDATTCEACGAEFEPMDEDEEGGGEEGEEGEEEDYEVEDEEEEGEEDAEGEDEELEEGEEGELEEEDELAEDEDEDLLEEEEGEELEEGTEGEDKELEEEKD